MNWAHPASHTHSAAMHHEQRGVVLFIALIVLVVLTLAGLALIRSSSTGLLVAGNLAFRQGAVASADAGVEAAVAWLRSKGPVDLEVDAPTEGYYASWDSAFKPGKSGIWEAGKSKLVGAEDKAGNTMRYVIHRMCPDTGPQNASPCVTVASATSKGSKGGSTYGSKPLTGSIQVYYRITVRADGPRNTVSYVQAMIY